MVRKVRICFAIMVLCCVLCTTAHAQSYTTYDGNISTSYVTYFRDIVNGLKLNENYVFFRAGQYQYVMVVGDLVFANGSFTCDGDSCKVYSITSDSSYNSTYTYDVSTDASFTLSVGDRMVYSDLGDFPQLVERGSKYETITAVLIGISLLSVVIKRILG